MSLYSRNSWERGNHSRNWWFTGLLDRAQTNSFIVFRERNKPSQLSHSQLYKALTNQLYHIAHSRMDHNSICSAATKKEAVDYSILHPQSSIPDFHREVLQSDSISLREEAPAMFLRNLRGHLEHIYTS